MCPAHGLGDRAEDASNEDALRYIRSKAFRTGQDMRIIQLGLPGAVGGGQSLFHLALLVARSLEQE